MSVKLQNNEISHIVTITIDSFHGGNSWETGKHDIASGGRAPEFVTRGRTYSLTITNARGDVWNNVAYEVGSGLTYDKRGRTVHPTVADVLNSLTLDASCVEYLSFGDWCDEFGYDTDSRKALEMFIACGETASNISRMFTPVELEAINRVTEDM